MSSFSRCCGLFFESPGIFSGPENFFVFAFKIKNPIILKNNTMKLSVNGTKLNGLWARNCATIQQVVILKFAFAPENFPGLSRNRSLGLVHRVGLVGKSGITCTCKISSLVRRDPGVIMDPS